MFSIEFRINGVLIGVIKGRNLGYKMRNRGHLYNYKLYDLTDEHEGEGNVIHDKTDGIYILIREILERIRKNGR
ncbi:MAG: hypothetical protein ACOC80_07470 [Petrotogales bacterium]